MRRLRAAVTHPQDFLDRLIACSRSDLLLEVTHLRADSLAHLRLAQGEARWTVEPRTTFDPARLVGYTRKFPYAFHEMDPRSFDPEGDVVATLRGLGVSPVPSGLGLRCVVPDHRLLAIPANLQLLGDALAGDVLPVCQAPSLGWLLEAYAARSRPPTAWNASAWVLGETQDEILGPLTVGAERLIELLTPHGVSVTRDVALGAVVPSPVMWLLAHGGLGLDARHFARVSSDRHDRYSADEVVAVIAGAELVVLLVCSGGRESSEFFAERVRGLPAALLRRGVRTVIASPWPLEVLPATRWSEVFARHLRGGDTAAVAAFLANQTFVSQPPTRRLAMHVYGDPWFRVETAAAALSDVP